MPILSDPVHRCTKTPLSSADAKRAADDAASLLAERRSKARMKLVAFEVKGSADAGSARFEDWKAPATERRGDARV